MRRAVPPTFLLFINRDELFSDQYKKYLGGELCRAFGYEGCPLVLVPKPRPKTIEPIRKFKLSQRKHRSADTLVRALAAVASDSRTKLSALGENWR